MLTLEFLIGQLLHDIKRIDLILDSPKNEVQNLRDVLRRYGIQFVFQFAVGIGFFNGILTNVWLLGHVWKPLAQFQWSWGTALLAGLVFDYVADWALERYPTLQRVVGRNDGAPR